jgi:putative cylicin-2
MIVGLVIVVSAYIFGGNFPIKGLGNGNLFIGFGFMLTGFLMTMGWK